MRGRRSLSCACLFAAGALLVAACSSDGDSGAGATTSPSTDASTSTPATPESSAPESPPTNDAGTTTTAAAGPTCTPPTTTTPIQATDLGNNRDWDITSFDGTVIRTHWFPLTTLEAGAEAPVVLMGPGWGSAGDVNEDAPGFLGAISIKTLRDAGFNVLTWDPRGFGESTGSVEIDSVDYEARDVQQLLDWVATMPQVALDSTGDPRSGMVGASYGGGIQFVTAAVDCRVDALVPIIAWNSLETSLYKADTPKTGWGNLLATAATLQGASLDPNIAAANQTANATGTFDPAQVEWFAARGPADLVSDVNVPTLVIQGTVDTLFTLQEAATNYDLLQDAGVPTSMLWFCGGHGVCLTDPGDEARVGEAAVAWLDRYVNLDDSADIGSPFEFVDQNGVAYTSDGFPEPDGEPITATGSGTLQLIADGGAGPATGAAAGGPIGTFVLSITPGRATNAVDVTIPAPAASALVVGAPTLQLTYSGTVPANDRPTRVFAQLVDDSTGLVLGNQITPIEVVLDGASHTIEVPMEMIAEHIEPGTSLTLQLVATTVAYAAPQLGGTVTFDDITISLPVVTAPVAATPDLVVRYCNTI